MKKKFIIIGVIILVALLYLGYTAFQHATTYYYTVSEFQALSSSLDGEKVRVNGVLTEISSEMGTNKPRTSFVVSSGGKDLSAAYSGTVPDAFLVGNEVVVEGRLDSLNIFQVDTIITKCPSKYEPVKQ